MRAMTTIGGGIATIATALTLALSGCTAVSTAPSPTPTPTVEAGQAAALDLSAEPLSGNGPAEPYPGVEFPIPEGARSVAIDFSCEGGGPFTLEVGDSMALNQAVLAGTCSGTTSLAWPVSEKTRNTLSVWLPAGVAWTATPHFSLDEFESDPAIAAECGAFGEIYSALSNADQGYLRYQAFGFDEWTTRVDAAAADLSDLAETSTTDMASGFAELLAIVQSPDRAPGNIGATLNINELIGDSCGVNHTPLVLTAEFGG